MIYVINVTIFQERFSCRQTYMEIDCTLDQEKENQSGRLWSSTFTSRRVKKHFPQPAFLRFVQPSDKLLNSRKARKKKKAVECYALIVLVIKIWSTYRSVEVNLEELFDNLTTLI